MKTINEQIEIDQKSASKQKTISKQIEIDQEAVSKQVGILKKTEAALLTLASEYSEVPTQEELENKGVYDYVKKGCARLTKYRTETEKARKDLKAPYIDAGKRIDAVAKGITERIKKLEEPLKAVKKEFDEKEKRKEAARLAKIQAALDDIRNAPYLFSSKTSEEIEQEIERLNCLDFSLFMELEIDAIKARNDAVKVLGVCLDNALTKEQALVEEHKNLKSEVQPVLDSTDKELIDENSCQGFDVPDFNMNFSASSHGYISKRVNIIIDSNSCEFSVLKELLSTNQEAAEFFETLQSESISITLTGR